MKRHFDNSAWAHRWTVLSGLHLVKLPCFARVFLLVTFSLHAVNINNINVGSMGEGSKQAKKGNGGSHLFLRFGRIYGLLVGLLQCFVVFPFRGRSTNIDNICTTLASLCAMPLTQGRRYLGDMSRVRSHCSLKLSRRVVTE